MADRDYRVHEWWYVKHRRNPVGVKGRPRSPVPLRERQRRWAAKYKATLREHGFKFLKVPLPIEVIERLGALARDRGSQSETLAQIIRTAPLLHDETETDASGI